MRRTLLATALAAPSLAVPWTPSAATGRAVPPADGLVLSVGQGRAFSLDRTAFVAPYLDNGPDAVKSLFIL